MLKVFKQRRRGVAQRKAISAVVIEHGGYEKSKYIEEVPVPIVPGMLFLISSFVRVFHMAERCITL